MSFCFLYNVVSENHSVQNSPWGGRGSIASSRSKMIVTKVALLFKVANINKKYKRINKQINKYGGVPIKYYLAYIGMKPHT